MSVLTAATRATDARPRLEVLRDYISLFKLRIVSLLLVTAVAPMLPAAHGRPSLRALVAVLVGGTLAAAGAHAINCWFDRDIDASMTRTRRRPIPEGRIPAWHAVALGVIANVAAFAVLLALTNLLAASLAILGTLIYVFVYTIWLKRSTPQNIVIGGAAGAIPPLVGWAAVTGRLDLTALSLFLVIFFWTPPHFWALAQVISGDYARAGVPMMPNVKGGDRTRLEILAYTLLLVAVALAPWPLGVGGRLYAALAIAAGLAMVHFAWRVYRIREGAEANRAAMRLFGFSIVYLFLLFAALVAEHGLGLIARFGL
jgi:protoheme IX farnesyltransferase